MNDHQNRRHSEKRKCSHFDLVKSLTRNHIWGHSPKLKYWWCNISVSLVYRLPPRGFQRKVHQSKISKGFWQKSLSLSSLLSTLDYIWLYLPLPEWQMHPEIIWLSLCKCSRKYRMQMRFFRCPCKQYMLSKVTGDRRLKF